MSQIKNNTNKWIKSCKDIRADGYINVDCRTVVY